MRTVKYGAVLAAVMLLYAPHGMHTLPTMSDVKHANITWKTGMAIQTAPTIGTYTTRFLKFCYNRTVLIA